MRFSGVKGILLRKSSLIYYHFPSICRVKVFQLFMAVLVYKLFTYAETELSQYFKLHVLKFCIILKINFKTINEEGKYKPIKQEIWKVEKDRA